MIGDSETKCMFFTIIGRNISIESCNEHLVLFGSVLQSSELLLLDRLLQPCLVKVTQVMLANIDKVVHVLDSALSEEIDEVFLNKTSG